jgi:hypothetical protein
MTYDALIEKIRLKSSSIINDWESLRAEKIFGAMINSLGDVANTAKLATRQEPLSIISGTVDYNIRTQIADDVGEIYQLRLPTGEIIEKPLDEFEDIKAKYATNEFDESARTGTPKYFKVWEVPTALTLYIESAAQITPTSVEINCTTNKHTTAVLNYGTTSGSLTTSVSDTTAKRYHSFIVTGLKTDQEYYWTVIVTTPKKFFICHH